MVSISFFFQKAHLLDYWDNEEIVSKDHTVTNTLAFVDLLDSPNN